MQRASPGGGGSFVQSPPPDAARFRCRSDICTPARVSFPRVSDKQFVCAADVVLHPATARLMCALQTLHTHPDRRGFLETHKRALTRLKGKSKT